MKTRSLDPEIMDQPGQPPSVTSQFHRDLALIHSLMGNWAAIADRLRASGDVHSAIDIGCGDGALLAYLRANAGIAEIVGVDLKPPACASANVSIVVADAVHEPLPHADAAVALMLLHHLSEDDVIALIRNVGRSVKRFICLDPVRHSLPLVLYTVFLCPFLSRVGALDGRQSIRRSFRQEELGSLVARAVAGTGATVEHWVSPFRARQIVDIRWPK